MNCHSCGATIRIKGNFCQACGVNLTSNTEATSAKVDKSPSKSKAKRSQKVAPNKLLSTLESACPKGESADEERGDLLLNMSNTIGNGKAEKQQNNQKPEQFQHITLAEYKQIKYESESSASNEIPIEPLLNEISCVEDKEEEAAAADTDEEYPEQSDESSAKDTFVIEVQRKPLFIAIILSVLCGVAYFGFASKIIRPIPERTDEKKVNSPLKYRGELSKKYSKKATKKSVPEKQDEKIESERKKERGKLLAPLTSSNPLDEQPENFKSSDEPISEKPPVSTKHLPDPGKPIHDPSTPLVISGEWQIKYQSDNVVDRVTIKQWGDTFEGHGYAHYKSGDIHAFELVDGTINYNKIRFTKLFHEKQRNGKVHPHPVSFRGKVDRSEDQLLASGIFDTKFNVGHFYNKREAARSGPWNAILIEPHPAETGFQPIHVNMPAFQFNLLLGIGFLGICSIIAFISFKLFSSTGLISRLEGEEFIPAQYKKMHREMLKEMGQKLVAGSLPLGKRSGWRWWCPIGPKKLTLPPEVRELHPNILLLGNSGSGKSKLMASMIIQDIKTDDRAVVVIDSDDSLTDSIIEHIASNNEMEEHASRFIILDPTVDSDTIYSFNPLAMPDDGNLKAVCDLIVRGVANISDSKSPWNEQCESILSHTLLLLIPNNKSLIDIERVLQDEEFRDSLIANLENQNESAGKYNEILKASGELKQLSKQAQWQELIEPILTRTGTIMDDSRIKRVFEKSENALNLKEIISGGYVLILKLPEVELNENGNLIGSLVVGKLKQESIALHKHHREEHNPLAIYMEDPDKFLDSESFNDLAKISKRYQIGCISSLQTLGGISKEFKEILLTAVDIFLIFATDKKDAQFLSTPLFQLKFESEDLSEEETTNINRLLIDQPHRSFFCFRNGSSGGVFNLKTEELKNADPDQIDNDLIEEMWSLKNFNPEEISE